VSTAVIDEDCALLRSWGRVFVCIHLASRLQSITLSFNCLHDSNCAPVTQTLLLELQSCLFLSTIDAHPRLPLLTSFTINALLDVVSDHYNTFDLSTFFSSLKHLNVDVLVLGEDEEPVGLESATHFWDTFATHVLAPATNLRSLSLGSTDPFGTSPRVNFNELIGSKLTSLTLHKVQFNAGIDPNMHPSQAGAESMILRLAKTLEHLELDNCTIHIFLEDSDEGLDIIEYPRRWADIWDGFSRELNILRELIVKGALHIPTRYSFSEFDDDHIPLYDARLEGEEKDRLALENLCDLVRSRPKGYATIM
jgi:hypothetical protein